MGKVTEKPGSKPAVSKSRTWEALAPRLSDWLLEAVSSMGFSRMTPVQASTIPLFVGNKDVVVEAVTGSGKTLSFLIPVVERLLRLEEPIRKHHIGAIIISPTRELAQQIHSVLLSLLAFHPASAAHLFPVEAEETSLNTTEPETTPPINTNALKIVPQLLLGGTTTPAQDLSHFLKQSPNLLISTPGRLLELLSSPHVHCPQSSFEVLVMDEADRLLDLGFKEDLQKILQRLPKQRRTGLFSASISEAVDQLVRVGLRNPVRIAVKVKSASGAEDGRTPASLKMTYLTTSPTHKIPAMLQIIRNLDPAPLKTIAYVSTCAAVEYLQHLLPLIAHRDNPLVIVPLHGRQTPQVRQKNFTKFTTAVSPALLLTTDLAARGLDIPAVDLSIQLDPPSDPKTFLHRAGRAGRAGRRGLSVVFLLPGRETEEYPAFLQVRRTPVSALTDAVVNVSDDEAAACITKMRAAVRKDRTLHDKGQRAFPSWVKSYDKHEAKSIFRIADLDWRALGDAWGLLKLPRMPELRKAEKAGTWDGDAGLGVKVDWARYAYKDAAKEKKRKEQMQEMELKKAEAGDNTAGVVGPGGPQGEFARKKRAWTDKKSAKEVKEQRREKKEVKREKQRVNKLTDEEKARERVLQRVIETAAADRDEFTGFD